MDNNILLWLFSTTAQVLAALAGLIGSFSIFRLQAINAEINASKVLVLDREYAPNLTLRKHLIAEHYATLEKIYDPTAASLKLFEDLLRQFIGDIFPLEYAFDLKNLEGNQALYNSIKELNMATFKQAVALIFVSLILLSFSNMLAATAFIWLIVAVFLVLVGLVLYQFTRQIQNLVE